MCSVSTGESDWINRQYIYLSTIHAKWFQQYLYQEQIYQAKFQISFVVFKIYATKGVESEYDVYRRYRKEYFFLWG